MVKSERSIRLIPGLLVLLLMISMPTWVIAREVVKPRGIEELKITTRKRTETLQNVPVSVVAVPGKTIDNLGINNLNELSAYVPNLRVNDSSVFLRGIGSGFNSGFEQSVGLYIDGVYMPRSAQYQGALLDLQRVEVIRGPQGVLFGKNTIAGAISVHSADPSSEFESKAKMTYGQYDTQGSLSELEFVVSGPLSQKASGRLALQKKDSEGFLENTTPGRTNGAESDNLTLRAGLRWTEADLFDLVAKYTRGDLRGKGSNSQLKSFGSREALFVSYDPAVESNFDRQHSAGVAVAGPQASSVAGYPDDFAGIYPAEQDIALDLRVFSVTGELELKNGYLVNIVAADSRYDTDSIIDADSTVVPLLVDVRKQDFRQDSVELRLTSPAGGRFETIVGVYYEDTDYEVVDQVAIDWAIIAGFNIFVSTNSPDVAALRNGFAQQTEHYALFGEVVWNISQRWRMGLGGRYTTEDKDISKSLTYLNGDGSDLVAGELPDDLIEIILNGPPLFLLEHQCPDPVACPDTSRSETNNSPQLTLEHDLTEDLLLYFSATRGFKMGGFNGIAASADLNDPGRLQQLEFGTETVDAIEVGSKSILLEGSLHLNVAAFYMEYDDLQVSSFNGFQFIVGNAAATIAQGLELDLAWRPLPPLTIHASYAYLDAEYDSFENAAATEEQVAAGMETQDLSGRRPYYAPEHSASMGATTIWPAADRYTVIIQLDANYTGEFYYQQDNDPLDKQGSFTKYNLRIALLPVASDWEVALLVKNLSNKTVGTSGSDVPILLDGAHVKGTAAPRTFLVQLKWTF